MVIIAKVFYCGGLSGRLGILRAVVPVTDLQRVLSKDRSKYLGKSFPKIKEAGTVIQVAPDEQGYGRQAFIVQQKDRTTLRTICAI